MADPAAKDHPYASRGGLKLEHALREFGVDVRGRTCADLGCSTGGFTDCLLQHGAARVYAVDTAYGELAWKLRTDDRVVVMERTNALHATPAAEGVDLVVIDLGWTPQRKAIPAALGWLREGGRIITLIKPHYELTEAEREAWLVEGKLEASRAEAVAKRVPGAMAELGLRVVAWTKSPIVGGGSRGRRGGNAEWLALMERQSRT